MRSETDCEPHEKYLVFPATVSRELYLSDLQERINTEEARAFKTRIEEENEVAVYTSYAYADIPIPKKFEIIFECENPDNFIETEFEVTHVLLSIAGFHFVEEIGHGHNHICIMKFKDEIPLILNLVKDISEYLKDGDFKKAKYFCMCQKVDFESIRYYFINKFIKNTEG